jgi:ADP-glucose pyrophosphorylase
MECEKYNSTFYNINIDLLKRKLKELKKLKWLFYTKSNIYLCFFIVKKW